MSEPAIAARSTLFSSRALGQRENIERAALLREQRKVLHRVGETTCTGSIADIEITRYDSASPSADARMDGDVLLAVGPAVRHGLTDDSGVGPELPQQGTALRIERFENAVHR